MAGNNWMDDRERAIRERQSLGDSPRASRDENRSWDSGGNRDDEVFGIRQSGASYGRAGPPPPRGGSAAGGWQDPNYGGVSPAMRQGGGYGQGRFADRDDRARDDNGGGRFYGDDSQDRIYREEYGQGGVEYGDVPKGYDAGGYSPTRARYHQQGYGRSGYGGYAGEMNRPASGGTGGYDYERGYGDAGRSDGRTGESRADRFEDAGRGAGEFLHRAGEKVASWFGGGGGGEGAMNDPNYLDPNPNASRNASRGARGLGPAGYKRSDERISDDAHDRLTDDTWLDASNIAVAVSGGEITLSGTVDSRQAKHRAEHLVEDLAGVNHVQNNLRIASGNPATSPGASQGDSVLGAQIRATDVDAAPAENGSGGAGAGQSTAGRKI